MMFSNYSLNLFYKYTIIMKREEKELDKKYSKTSM